MFLIISQYFFSNFKRTLCSVTIDDQREREANAEPHSVLWSQSMAADNLHETQENGYLWFQQGTTFYWNTKKQTK